MLDSLIVRGTSAVLYNATYPSVAAMTTTLFTLTSPAFANGGSIPSVYTRCDGKDVSPPLAWSGIPPATKSLALIVDGTCVRAGFKDVFTGLLD